MPTISRRLPTRSFTEAIIPAQKAGSTVYWLIVVTNENGLSSVTGSNTAYMPSKTIVSRTARAEADSLRPRKDSEEPELKHIIEQKKLWN